MIEMRSSFPDVRGDSDMVGTKVVFLVRWCWSNRADRLGAEQLGTKLAMTAVVACVTRWELSAAMLGIGRECGSILT